MSSYFDNAVRKILDLDQTESDAGFLAKAQEVEDEVIQEVILALADPEIPKGFLDHTQNLIARWAVSCSEKGQRHLMMTRGSRLLSDLHVLFHRLAEARIQTRFGLILDDPRAIIRCRGEHELPASLRQAEAGIATSSEIRALLEGLRAFCREGSGDVPTQLGIYIEGYAKTLETAPGLSSHAVQLEQAEQAAHHAWRLAMAASCGPEIADHLWEARALLKEQREALERPQDGPQEAERL